MSTWISTSSKSRLEHLKLSASKICTWLVKLCSPSYFAAIFKQINAYCYFMSKRSLLFSFSMGIFLNILWNMQRANCLVCSSTSDRESWISWEECDSHPFETWDKVSHSEFSMKYIYDSLKSYSIKVLKTTIAISGWKNKLLGV